MKRKLAKSIVISLLVLLSLSFIVLSSGCAAKTSRMIPKEFEVISTHPYSICVNESTGGIDPKPLWHSEISNTPYTEALIISLKKSGIFQNITTARYADYILDVSILEYDRPTQGANIIIRMDTIWKLTNAKTNEAVWTEHFKTSYRAEWGKSIFDDERIELAHEGAVRTNIKEGIRRLSLLSL